MSFFKNSLGFLVVTTTTILTVSLFAGEEDFATYLKIHDEVRVKHGEHLVERSSEDTKEKFPIPKDKYPFSFFKSSFCIGCSEKKESSNSGDYKDFIFLMKDFITQKKNEK